ncbi:MAG TPA: phosphate ABC transporter substrate-binding protein PstS [Acidimicrobiia bacterium]|jgi:phosphate transport system substrate-binding protein|nr:phosphate ABC transporter substrate-binding protein PstS [Acidimicrobiia bacterium]
MTKFIRRHALPPLAVLIVVLAAACGSSSSNGGASNTSGSTGSTGAQLSQTTLSGSGSTFQDPFDEAVFRDFTSEAQPNVTVNYNPVGSGQGQTDLAGGVTDFAGSDSLVKDADKSSFKGSFLYIPIASAPITISFNVNGVDKLTLSASTLAKIFSTSIKTWDDSAIKADNPGVDLPSTSITVVHRSDGSGTTSNFTSYLAAAAPSDWTLGSDKTVAWASSTVGAEGNPAVASKIKGTDGAIGYVDFADATQAGLKFASIKNSAGSVVAPTLDGATAAMASATVTADVTVSPMNAPGADAYPITSPTYLIVYSTQSNHAKGLAVKALLEYVLGPGQQKATALDFAPLPDALLAKAKAQVDKIQVP